MQQPYNGEEVPCQSSLINKYSKIGINGQKTAFFFPLKTHTHTACMTLISVDAHMSVGAATNRLGDIAWTVASAGKWLICCLVRTVVS